MNPAGRALLRFDAGTDIDFTYRALHRDGDGWLALRVTDEGRGIPGDQLEAVFERFVQIDASDRRDKGGTAPVLAHASLTPTTTCYKVEDTRMDSVTDSVTGLVPREARRRGPRPERSAA